MFDRCATVVVRSARRLLGERLKRYRPPADPSPLNSIHYLLAEYEEPEPAAPARPYKAEATGGVGREVLRLAGAGSGRSLRVDLSFPQAGPSRLPAVLISPGLGAPPGATRYLEDHLAAHGYLVVRPTHRGSDWLGSILKTPFGAFTRAELRRRVEELEITLQAVHDGDLGWETGELGVALVGHSFGALTTGLLAGLRAEGVRPRCRWPVSAYVALSPYGDSFPTRRLGIESASFQHLRPPTLFVSGTRDDLWTLGKGPAAHLEPYLACRSGSNMHLLIGGTRHGHFSQVCGWLPRHTRLMVTSTTTAFLDAHIRGEAAAFDYLEQTLPLVACQNRSWRL